MQISPAIRPPLDPGFVPAALWNRAYEDLVDRDLARRRLQLGLLRPHGPASLYETWILSANHPSAALTGVYVERLLKFLLWQRGASRVLVAGAPEVAEQLARIYAPGGARAFDAHFMGARIFGAPFSVSAASFADIAPDDTAEMRIGRHLQGCRIGFDLGGSDRKVAALIDGRVVFSEEIPWDPYFQTDPSYHFDGVQESLRRAAAHLPRVDAIGGSAAGVYVDNEVRASSLFRGISPELFERRVRRMFHSIQEAWDGVPFMIVNDGEVTALAGSIALGANAVLGISLGTSQAGGYVTPTGGLTPWLNELAFAPIDHRHDAPRDEWSGDAGCGVQYFSQQAVNRLARPAGFEFPADLSLPERLTRVQEALAAGDPRATAIFESIGVCLGYALGYYSRFYEMQHVLALGRVTSGAAGSLILDQARRVLHADFPSLAKTLSLHLPDERQKRHGQAIAAASLPELAAHPVQP
jgi:predicted NBD/HSP70 family sugar kinase